MLTTADVHFFAAIARSETLAARRAVVAGHLRVLAPLGFGRQYVAPVASRFCAEHAEVTLDLVLSDRLGRVPDTSWDVAVHIGELRDSPLIATRLAPNDRLLREWSLPAADVVAFVGPRRGRSARATRFLDALRDALNPAPWRAGS